MTRLITFLLGVLAAAAGLSWLADNPGTITIDWLGYRFEPTVFQAVVGFLLTVMAAMFCWSLFKQIWTSPATVGQFLAKRRQRRGLDALSSGMIAIGAGDRSGAMRYAVQARKSLPNEPLTHLLRAQAAQLSGDRATARRVFEAMLASPDTEQLGLRGLYLEAQREGEREAQLQFAQRAVRLNPKLAWPAEALFDLQCRNEQWEEALETLSTARRAGNISKPVADRRRAVLLTAQAQVLEEQNPDKALTLAMEAHGLAPDLVPAAAIAGRLFASKGSTGKAAKIIQKTWAKSPHPDLATAYAYARIGDSPKDRLDRVRQLAALNPHSPESPVAVAIAAIEAHQYKDARHALAPLVDGRLTRRVAMLMARIEGEELGDKGRVRQWLARAVNAPRDPAWTADGVVSEQWAPISPVTGALDAFSWRVPVAEAEVSGVLEETEDRIDELVEITPELTEMPLTSVAVKDERGSQADETKAREPDARLKAKPDDVVDAEAVPVDEAAPAAVAKEDGAATALAEKAHTEAPRSQSAQKAGASAPAAAKTSRGGKARPEPKIFVPPHAPDDPGAGDDEEDGVAQLKPPYRAIP